MTDNSTAGCDVNLYVSRLLKGLSYRLPPLPWSPIVDRVRHQREIDWQLPSRLQLETTNLCNQHCNYCPREEATRGFGLMDWELFTRIIDEMTAPGRPRHYSLHKDGEPLLHPRCVDMMAYIYRADPRNTLYLTTNGMRLKGELAEQIARVAPNVLNVSVGAATEPSFQIERGARGLERVQENVLRFLELRDRYQPKDGRRTAVSVQIVDTRQTHGELRDFYRFWERTRVDDINVWGKFNWGGAVDDEGAEVPARRYPCARLWLYPAVNWDGQVSICAFDWNAANVIGDLRTQTMAEVWQGEALAQYRRRHLLDSADMAPLCRACNAWAREPDLFFPWQRA